MSNNIVVIAEARSGQLKKASLEAISAGKDLAGQTGGQVTVVVLGDQLGGWALKVMAMTQWIPCCWRPVIARMKTCHCMPGWQAVIVRGLPCRRWSTPFPERFSPPLLTRIVCGVMNWGD